VAWPILTARYATRQHLTELATGAAGAVRLTQFLSDQLCGALLSDLPSEFLTRYDEVHYPVQAYRFGPTLNEHQNDGSLSETYWSSAAAANSVRDALVSHDALQQRIIDEVSKASRGDILSASINGREAYWPIIREISHGTLLHWDDVSREYPDGLFDQQIHHQFAANVFLQAPSVGGELRIWGRKWQPADERHSYTFGYQPELMHSSPDLTIHASNGEAIIFNPTYYHDVLPSDAGARRITASFFIGTTDSGIVLWS